MDVPSDPPLRVVDLGRLAYAPALAEQRRVNRAVIDGAEPATLLLVEHHPVITVTPRPAAAAHVVAPPPRLAALGIDVQETDRGGDVTYHGPGQLVAYPILRLNDFGLNLGRYMRFLEQVVIDTLAEFGVAGERDACATGVWVRAGQSTQRQQVNDESTGTQSLADASCSDQASLADASCSDGSLAKICAMGVRVRKNTTMHGLALNITTDLLHFQTIVPCGLAGRPVTSLRELLGVDCPSMDDVKRALVERFQRAAAERRAALPRAGAGGGAC